MCDLIVIVAMLMCIVPRAPRDATLCFSADQCILGRNVRFVSRRDHICDVQVLYDYYNAPNLEAHSVQDGQWRITDALMGVNICSLYSISMHLWRFYYLRLRNYVLPNFEINVCRLFGAYLCC